MIRRHLTRLILTTLLLTDVGAVQAQWWLITKGSPQGELLEAREQVRTFLAQQGTGVLEAERVRAEFESEISVPPTFISQNQINEWVEQSRTALVSLANADYEEARQALLRAQELSQRAAEELNRETDRARAVLDTCLYMVRAFVETGDQEGAREQARNCRRLVPQIEPSRRRHTPEVRAVLEQLDEERNAAPGVLRVESTPSNCVVRLNGIQVGRTPFAMPDLARGEYRVQVECGEARGRVHHLSLDDEVIHLNVDTVFDQEMHSRPVYVDDNARADAHAATLATKVQATIVMVSREGSGYRLTRFEQDWRSSSRVVPFERLEQAVQQIVSRESGEPYDTGEDDAPYEGPLPAWRVGLGAAVLAAGVGLSIAAAAVHVQRDAKGDLYIAAFPGDTDFLIRQRNWQAARTVVVSLAMTGGALAALSIPAWLPNRRGIHWASWASGGLGLLGGATALALTLARSSCPNVASDVQPERRSCVARDQRGGAAAMIGGASMMLFAVPIVDALQGDRRRPESASLNVAPHAGRGSAGLTLRGEF